MKLFDAKAERKIWIAIIASIPFLLFLQWNIYGTLNKTGIFITVITILFSIGILYFVKWYSNKK